MRHSEDDQSHADLFSERRGSARGRGQAVYLRLRTVEEEAACTTPEIPDRHAGKTLRRTEEQKRRRRPRRQRRRRSERNEDGREERRTGTG